MKIKAFPNKSGSGQWRLIHPLKYIERLGHTVSIADTSEDAKTVVSTLVDYDIIIPQGVVDVEALKILLGLKYEYGIKIVIDFDDMIEVTPDNPNYKDHEIWDASPILQSFTKFADAVTTTNEHLAKYLRKFNEKVFILPNYMDLEYWQLPIQKNETDKVRICYVGSCTHLLDIEMVAPALKKILKRYGDKVELLMVGDLRWREVFKGYNNVDCLLGVPFENYASRLNGLGMDIGIAPLRDNEFNRCKSNIKWMENTIAGGVTVASPTVYSETIKHGVDGFIASSTEEWVKYLSELIENKDLRDSVHSRAYSEVVGTYSWEKNIKKWEKVYKDVLKSV